ncbi:Las1-domain-containing protein [Schizopora paradoxa]|uniref:Las1-domain-containing protein n=1 Tax=Schizopora paradoxa TaxID=27342 RepID=A0A0H2SSB7_9AGAM|nr:Las1-domain-containing protein [Schizopora paradoxa]
MHSRRRRVPWASLAELDQVCSWIYADESDIDAKIRAVNRLSAWKCITQIPHALESTLSLLVAILQDNSSSQSRSGTDLFPTSTLSIRQGYATALIRLVNGLVDPLQQGVYARSIAGIAAQIGLPQWLVELRHAATHEELPSLEMLRAGARESMTWLLHNYFMPTLSPPESSNAASQLTPPTALLKEYKSLLKLTVRDASLKTRHKADETKILRDIERWIAEAKIAAAAVVGDVLGSRFLNDDAEDDAEGDPRESWALDRLCEELLGRGALVPVASKKRENPNEADSLPTELLEIWTPLLESVAANHQVFPSVLVTNIVNTLLYGKQGATGDELSRKDKSYEQCIARWAVFVVGKWGDSQNTTTSQDSKVYLAREDVVAMLLTVLGSSEVADSSGNAR